MHCDCNVPSLRKHDERQRADPFGYARELSPITSISCRTTPPSNQNDDDKGGDGVAASLTEPPAMQERQTRTADAYPLQAASPRLVGLFGRV